MTWHCVKHIRALETKRRISDRSVTRLHHIALVVLLAAFAPAPLHAQSNTDSLRQVWEDPSRVDSVRYSACFDLIMGLIYSYPDSARIYALDLEKFTSQRKMDSSQGSAINLIASSYWVQGEYAKALAGFDTAVAFCRRIGDQAGVAAALSNSGNVFYYQGRYAEALAFQEQALVVLRAHRLTAQEPGILNNIAALYRSQGKNSEAAEYFVQAMRLFDSLGRWDERTVAEENLAGIYKDQKDYDKAEAIYTRALQRATERKDVYRMASLWQNMAALSMARGDTAMAERLYYRALPVIEKQGAKKELTMAYNNLGLILRSRGSLDSAAVLANKALSISEAIDDDMGKALALYSLGDVALMRGDATAAIAFGERSLALSMATGDKEQKLMDHELLHQAYARIGRTKEAYQHATDLLTLRDSANTDAEQRTLLRLEYRYDYDKQALADSLSFAAATAIQHEEVQKQKLMRNGFMGGFALVAVFAGVFFFQRNRIKKEKDRSEELLLNILPEEVAEELKNTGGAAAKHFENATILFTDFKGFTQASEKLSPQELVEELNTCFMAFDHIITARGIEKIKTIGDAYMCAGGLPDPMTSSPADVVHAALEMQTFMVARKKERDAQGLPAFEMRVGIHTGPVVAGIVGVKKFQYDIWGDTVNTASRMESSGEVGQVNISEATYALVKGEPGLSFTPRGKVQAKGKGEMEMYFVGRAEP